MKRFLKWLFLLLAVLVLSAAVLLLNPGLLRQPMENYLGNLTGRAVFLDGDIDIDIGGTTGVSVARVRVSSPAWAQNPYLAELGQLNLSLPLSSLFGDTVIIESLQLDSLQLQLETDADGNGNWKMPGQPVPEKKEPQQSKRLIISDILVTNSDVRFKDGQKRIDHVLLIESYKQHQGSDGTIRSDLSGSFNGRQVVYSGTAGPFENILNGKNISFESKGHFGELKISGSGLIDDLFKPRKPDFTLSLEGPDIDEVSSMLGIDDLGGGVFSFNASGGEVNGHYEAGIDGEIGDVSLHGSLRMEELSGLDKLDLEVSFDGPRLGAVARVFGIDRLPDRAFDIDARVHKRGRTLDVSELALNIGDIHLRADALISRFPDLDAGRVKMRLSGEDFNQFKELVGLSLPGEGAFELRARLDPSPDGLELVEAGFASSLGNATFTGTLGEAPSYSGSKFRLQFNGPNAQAVLAAFGIDALPPGPFDLDADIELHDGSLSIGQGVLQSSENDRLEFGGSITFNPGIEGSDLDVRASGKDLGGLLHRLAGITGVPDQPYDIEGKIRVKDNGLELIDTRGSVEGIDLGVNGRLLFVNGLAGSTLDLDVDIENISSLSKFEMLGDSLAVLPPAQGLAASGRLVFGDSDWEFDRFKGSLGMNSFGLDAVLSKKAGLAGSSVRFAVDGPDLREVFSQKMDVNLPPEPFEASGQAQLSDKSLFFNEVAVKIGKARGHLDAELAWPPGDDVNIRFDVDAEGQDVRNILPRSDVFAVAKSDFRIDAEGKIENDEVSLKMFKARVGGLDLYVTGEMQNDTLNSSAGFSLVAKSADISSLGIFKGAALPALPMDLQADVAGNARQFGIRHIQGRLGDSRFNGSLDVSLSGSRPSLRLTTESGLVDLGPFIEMMQAEKKAESGETAHAGKTRDRLIPATPIPLELLKKADIQTDINILELKFRNTSLKNLKVDMVLDEGVLDLSELYFDAAKGTLDTSLSLRPLDSGKAGVQLDLNASNLFFNTSGLSQNRLGGAPEFDIEIHANGTGSNLRELAATANGAAFIKSRGGKLEGISLSVLDAFILEEIFKVLMPKSPRQPVTQLTCAAAIFNIEDGVVHTNPALTFTTDRIAVITKGKVDLKTEEMNLNFNAIPKNALKISASELFNPYILIGGTLAKPSVGLDPAKTLLHGGAAIGTAGLSILAKGLIDRLGNSADLCEELLDTPLQP